MSVLEITEATASENAGVSVNGTTAVKSESNKVAGVWDRPLEVAVNNFKHKSLSDFSGNIAVGCDHGCRFCYVPGVSANKQAEKLSEHGVTDPDAEWGNYVLLRPFDEKVFRKSVKRAEKMAPAQLSRDGHRAVMFSTTTDPYQVIFHPDRAKREELNKARETMVRRSLEIIRDDSTLNVRVLTRSPLVKKDFDLLKSLGNRVVLGVSLPTMRADLAKLYEPGAPSPRARLQILKEASEAGIPVYLAMAPTFPESGYDDILATMKAVKEVCDPVTVFHEPINIRADNVDRIAKHAETMGVEFAKEVFQSPETWEAYALQSFADVERAAKEVGLYAKLHLWVDGALGSKACRARQPNSDAYGAWVDHWWNRISEWPRDGRPEGGKPAEVALLGELRAPGVRDAADDKFFNEKDGVIRRGTSAHWEAAVALCDVRDYADGKLWSGDHSTFHKFVEKTWKISKSHASRMIAYGEFLRELKQWVEGETAPIGAISDYLPHSECQVRPITQLPKALQVQVWLDILAEKDISEVTGALVAARVKPLKPVKTPRVPVVAPVVAAAPAVMPDDVLTDLEVCLSDHPKYDEIAQFIESIRELVKAS